MRATAENMRKGPVARRQRSEAMFIACFAEQPTLKTSEVAAKLGRGHSSALNSLLEMERRQLIHRAGTAPRVGRGKPSIIWALGPKQMEQK